MARVDCLLAALPHPGPLPEGEGEGEGQAAGSSSTAFTKCPPTGHHPWGRSPRGSPIVEWKKTEVTETKALSGGKPQKSICVKPDSRSIRAVLGYHSELSNTSTPPQARCDRACSAARRRSVPSTRMMSKGTSNASIAHG